MNAPIKDPQISEVLDNARFEEIENYCRMLASYAISGAEAAWRGDRIFLGGHLEEAKMALAAGIKLFNNLTRRAEADE